MLLFKLFLKAIGKGLSSKYILSRHRREVHKEKVMTETQKKIKKMQEQNKNCKTPPPPPPPTKAPSNSLKSHPSPKSSTTKPPPPPTKAPSNSLKPHPPPKSSTTKPPPKKLSPPPPKKVVQNLKRKGHELYEKEPVDVIRFKKRNKSPGKAKPTAGVKRKAKLNLEEEEEEDENAQLSKRPKRQTRSATLAQTVTRNSNQANWQGGF